MDKKDKKNEKDCCENALIELTALVKMFLYGVAELESISDDIGKEIIKVCDKLKKSDKADIVKKAEKIKQKYGKAF